LPPEEFESILLGDTLIYWGLTKKLTDSKEKKFGVHYRANALKSE
jgi:hypothetical protein